MFAGRNKNGVIISDSPVVSAGISSFIMRNFDNTNLICCDFSHGFQSHALLGKHVIICDLSRNDKNDVYHHYLDYIHTGGKAHWYFLIAPGTQQHDVWQGLPHVNLLPLQVQESDLVAMLKPVLRSDDETEEAQEEETMRLTISERRVLRLLGRGLGVNQVASVLQKSNKTISAQKRSALRRLSLRSNADMYAWINSDQGREALSSEY